LGIGDPEGPSVWEVTSHPRWRGLLRGAVVGAGVLWAPAVVSPYEPARFPVSLRLDFPAGSAWLVAAMPRWPDLGHFYWPADELVVGFTQDFTDRLGLPTDAVEEDERR
jgi:hypothetical protein